MVEETQASMVETAPAAGEAAVLPETAPVAMAPILAADAAPMVTEATPKPSKARLLKTPKAKVVRAAKAEAPQDKPPVEASLQAKGKPAKAAPKAKPATKTAEKTPSKARTAKAPAVLAQMPAVKPATKRPFTAKPRVKQNSAAPKTTTAPRKELFAMATTSTEITEKMTAAFKEAQDKAKAALEKSQAAMGDVTEFTKGNVEAVVESTKILATGLQEMTKGYVAETKTVIETMTADVKDLTTVTSPTEFFQKQSALMRKSFDAAVAASSKNSEAMLKLATEAFQPISTRVSLAVEKMKQAA